MAPEELRLPDPAGMPPGRAQNDQPGNAHIQGRSRAAVGPNRPILDLVVSWHGLLEPFPELDAGTQMTSPDWGRHPRFVSTRQIVMF